MRSAFTPVASQKAMAVKPVEHTIQCSWLGNVFELRASCERADSAFYLLVLRSLLITEAAPFSPSMTSALTRIHAASAVQQSKFFQRVRCSTCQASLEHILDCLGLTKQDLYEDPSMVLDFFRVNEIKDVV
ncbi:hypothetical protein TNCV_972731 [Trichonephila clavipes]|nr:hypothetical protein TNCV_972731 [Trichonephila clavipes]